MIDNNSQKSETAKPSSAANVSIADQTNCPICKQFHFPEDWELDKLCYKHAFQLYLADMITKDETLQIFIN